MWLLVIWMLFHEEMWLYLSDWSEMDTHIWCWPQKCRGVPGRMRISGHLTIWLEFRGLWFNYKTIINAFWCIRMVNSSRYFVSLTLSFFAKTVNLCWSTITRMALCRVRTCSQAQQSALVQSSLIQIRHI